ncbi:acetyltransferase [Chitinophaga sp. NPDC101104]|uniref:acetyltransferase n=1 Tax=Chitinophaga sp. NPDC101104 TaxID=3390561 RepID=UPI003CFFB52A
MLITGAKGHAKEILQVLEMNGQSEELFFFDNINLETILYGQFPILRTLTEVMELFTKDKKFVLGTGNPLLRRKFTLELESIGGVLTSVISQNAIIGNHAVQMGEGVNIMHSAFISNSVFIGKGALINRATALHHDVMVGEYVELSPGSQLLGGSKIGAYSCLGAGAIVLPGIQIGTNVTVGAGAVVTTNVTDNLVVVGAPARKIKEKPAIRL